MNHVGKANQARPPEKGAFPLDRQHECDEPKTAFLACLKSSKSDHSACRDFSRKYLLCRQGHNLMDSTDLDKLGFREEDTLKAKQAATKDGTGTKTREGFVSGMHIKDTPKPATSRRNH